MPSTLTPLLTTIRDWSAYDGLSNMTASRGLINQPRKGAKWAFVELAVEFIGEGCLIWPYQQSWAGYGVIEFNGQRNYRVHRLVCEYVHGPAPDGKNIVAHGCGNPACVSPAHLRWATQAENLNDRIVHGTMIWGSRHYGAKLSEGDVQFIRRLIQAGWPDGKIAARYGVIRETIRAIRLRKTWGWL